MDWNQQQYTQPQASPMPQAPPAPQPMPPQPADMAQKSTPSPTTMPSYYGNSPLQGPMAAQPAAQTIGADYTPGASPVGQTPFAPVPPAMAGPAVGMPQLAARPAGQTAVKSADDQDVSADDVEWVNRAKRTIASSQGDPHRQVQLMQHLRALYLKQRFGRTVHTDEG